MRADRVIISRTDNIGDVVLTLPMVGILRRCRPDAEILFLGRGYTRPVIESCVHVDALLDWDEVADGSAAEQTEFLARARADTIIHVLPQKDIAAAARRARIPQRIGTSHRLFHLWNCNHRVHFTRRRSDLHEAQLDVKLLRPFGVREVPSLKEIGTLYGLTRVPPLRSGLARLLAGDRVNLVLHPKTKGNAKEWPLENYGRLIERLPADRFRIFVTGTREEAEAIGDRLSSDRRVTSLVGELSGADLVAFISRVDALVAASTGPLHLAAALGKLAVGLYAPKRPRHPGRWGPVGPRAHALVFDPECERCREKGVDCDCIRRIEPAAVASLLEPLAASRRRSL